jgi:hypothetical protein
VFKGKLYNLNIITPNTYYYTFDTNGSDVVSGTNYTTINGTGSNTTFLSIADTNSGVVSQNVPLNNAINGKSVELNLKFSVNNEARTIVKQTVPTAVDFTTTIDSSFTQLNITGNTNENAYLNGIYDASSSTLIAYENPLAYPFNTAYDPVGWYSDANYDYYTGEYVGSKNTVVQGVGTVSGEWLQLKTAYSYPI